MEEKVYTFGIYKISLRESSSKRFPWIVELDLYDSLDQYEFDDYDDAIDCYEELRKQYDYLQS